MCLIKHGFIACLVLVIRAGGHCSYGFGCKTVFCFCFFTTFTSLIEELNILKV